MTTTASLFSQNRDEIMTPILPADVNGPSQVAALGGAFSNAVNNDVKPAVAATSADNDNQRLANDAIGVGQTLRDPGQGIQAQRSDAVYLTNQIGNTLSQASTGLLSVLSDEHAGNENKNDFAETLEQNNRLAAPPPQIGLPSPSGFGGGPG